MTTKIQINDEESIEVSSVLTGMEEGFSAPREYNNVFAVTVTNGGVAETFDYHISVHDTEGGYCPSIQTTLLYGAVMKGENGKKKLTDADHIFAFYCFLGDAISGSQSFEVFCDEMGYDEDSRKAEKIWKACQEATQKADNLSIGDLYQVSNYIQEKYPDEV